MIPISLPIRQANRNHSDYPAYPAGQEERTPPWPGGRAGQEDRAPPCWAQAEGVRAGGGGPQKGSKMNQNGACGLAAGCPKSALVHHPT